ncbi:MAG: AbrB/MazE/SpoVT family DNA-binding domain-containing protein [bacterium]|jgi:antitoxin component of MazEF toxin-antitoxin module
MRKKLVKHGNSLAIVIDKPILELVGFNADTEVEIRTNGSELLIRPAEAAISEEEFKTALAELTARHYETLKKLAE